MEKSENGSLSFVKRFFKGDPILYKRGHCRENGSPLWRGFFFVLSKAVLRVPFFENDRAPMILFLERLGGIGPPHWWQLFCLFRGSLRGRRPYSFPL